MGPQNTPANSIDNRVAPVTHSTDATLSEALLVLRKRRWILLLAVVFGLSYGIYRAVSQPRVYISTGRIEVRSGSSNEYKVLAAANGSLDAQNHLTTEAAILQSDSLLLTVAKEMDLANNPLFLNVKSVSVTHSLDEPKTRQSTLSRLKNSLRVTPTPRTDLISISFTSPDAKLSADIVNTLIKDYMQRSYQSRFASTQRVSQWLTGQLDDLKQQVETSQEQLMELQRRLGAVGLNLDPTHTQTEISQSIDGLARAASDARINRIIVESRYRAVASADPESVESILDSSPGASGKAEGLANLRATLVEARGHFAELTATLGPNHPQVKALKAQIEEYVRQVGLEEQRLVMQAKQAYIAAKSSEDQTQAALEAQKADAYKLRDDLVEYTLRQREFESNRALYEGLLQRLRAAGVQAGLESMEIDVVDPALAPAGPTLQPATTLIMTTLLFSLFAGIVVAFVLESLDTGLRSVAEVEALTELPSLAIIPRSKRSLSELPSGLSTAQTNIGVLTMPKSQFSEAFRSLRTSILLATVPHPPRYILLTSATPSEGKTTTSTNLACILAQRDTRVLLMDADLRRPNVHHRFGLNGKIGVSTILTGATTLEDAVQQIPDVPNLDILPAGPVPPFPTEMLSSEGMQQLLDKCGTIYSHIVIDSPPILSVTDGVILARQADATVLVIRHGKNSKQIVRRARDLLIRSGASITGFVLNAVDINSPEYYGYYGYSGYSYANMDSDTWETANLPSNKRTSGDGA